MDGSWRRKTDQNEVSLLDAVTGQPRMILKKVPLDQRVYLRSLAFSPDGKTVAGGYSPPGGIVLWDAVTGGQRGVLPAYEPPPAYNPPIRQSHAGSFPGSWRRGISARRAGPSFPGTGLSEFGTLPRVRSLVASRILSKITAIG